MVLKAGDKISICYDIEGLSGARRRLLEEGYFQAYATLDKSVRVIYINEDGRLKSSPLTEVWTNGEENK